MDEKNLVAIGAESLAENAISILEDGWKYVGNSFLFMKGNSVLVLQTHGFKEQDQPLLLEVKLTGNSDEDETEH